MLNFTFWMMTFYIYVVIIDYIKIGKFIARCRKEKKLTWEQLAEKLNLSGCAISHYENGRRLPDYSIVPDLCRELGISINELFLGEHIIPEEKERKYEDSVWCLFKLNNIWKKKERLDLFRISLIFMQIVLINK